MGSTFLNIPNTGSPSWKDPVLSFSDLPLFGNKAGDARVVIDESDSYIWDGTLWVQASGTSAVTSVNGQVGTVVLTAHDFGLGTQDSPTFTGLTLSSLTPNTALVSNSSNSIVSNSVTGTGNVVFSNSPALTGVPTAPTPPTLDTSNTIATTAFVQAQGFLTSSGTIPTGESDNASAVTTTSATFVNALTVSVTTTQSAHVYALATFNMKAVGAACVAQVRTTINGVAGRVQNVSLLNTTDNYTGSVQQMSTTLNPGTYTVNFDISRLSGTGSVSYVQGTLFSWGLQGTNSNGITQLTGALQAGPGSGSQALTGTLPLANGGTNNTAAASNGAVVYSDATKHNYTAVGSTGQLLRSAGAASPTWTTATFPSTTSANQILYSSSANTVTGLATANTGALVTNSTGVPSIASGTTANRLLRTNGTTVSFAQAALATDVSGTLPAANGGTGHGNWANQQIPFGTGTSLSGDPLLIWDTVNTRLNVGGGGGSAVGNFINGSGSHVALNAYNYGGNNCIQAVQQNNNYNLSAATFSAAPTLGVLIGGQFGRGTIASPAQSLNGDIAMTIVANGTTATGATSGGFCGDISFIQTEDCTSTANGGDIVLGTSPNGTNTPIERVRVKNSGETVFQQAIALARFTTTQKNALTPTGGWVVFDTDLNQLSYYNGTSWVNL